MKPIRVIYLVLGGLVGKLSLYTKYLVIFNFTLYTLFAVLTFYLNLNFWEDLCVFNFECSKLVTNDTSYLFGSLFKLLFTLFNLLHVTFFNTLVTKTLTSTALVFTIKFILVISLLIFIRGGVPRYRYDFLTKIGWIKFLSLILSVFLSSLLLAYLF